MRASPCLFLGALLFTTAGAALATSASAAPDAPMLLHQVFFWLKSPGDKADRDKLIAGLKALKAIGVIQQLHVGAPASTEKRDVVDNSYDVSELMVFKSVEDQKTYQDHPLHVAFKDVIGPLVQDRTAADWIV